MELAKALLNLLIYMADLYDFIWQCRHLSSGSELKKKRVQQLVIARSKAPSMNIESDRLRSNSRSSVFSILKKVW